MYVHRYIKDKYKKILLLQHIFVVAVLLPLSTKISEEQCVACNCKHLCFTMAKDPPTTSQQSGRILFLLS